LKIFKNNNILVSPLKRFFGIQLENIEEIDVNSFSQFFYCVLEGIISYMPDLLKISLKLVYTKVNQIFTIEKSNYTPIFTLLFFNFLISPRMQEIHKISPVKNLVIRNMNRIIRVSK
jgi:hypothetical protein